MSIETRTIETTTLRFTLDAERAARATLRLSHEALDLELGRARLEEGQYRRIRSVAQSELEGLSLLHPLAGSEGGDAYWDEPRDFRPEIGLDIFNRRERVFDRVVQQGSDDRFLIELQVGHQAGHFDRM